MKTNSSCILLYGLKSNYLTLDYVQTREKLMITAAKRYTFQFHHSTKMLKNIRNNSTLYTLADYKKISFLPLIIQMHHNWEIIVALELIISNKH